MFLTDREKSYRRHMLLKPVVKNKKYLWYLPEHTDDWDGDEYIKEKDSIFYKTMGVSYIYEPKEL